MEGGNMVKEIVMMDYASVVCVLCLIIFILTNHYINKRIRMLFLVACVLSLCLVFVDSVEYWTASFSTMSPPYNFVYFLSFQVKSML